MSDTDWYLNRFRRKDIKEVIKNGGMFHAQKKDEELAKQHAYEMNRKNVCPRCHVVKSKTGECMC